MRHVNLDLLLESSTQEHYSEFGIKRIFLRMISFDSFPIRCFLNSLLCRRYGISTYLTRTGVIASLVP